MKTVLFISLVLLSVAGQAFILEGQQYSCKGKINQMDFKIQQEQKDAEGLSLVPQQFSGMSVDLITQEQSAVIFETVGPKEVDIWDVGTSTLLGTLKKSAVISFSRILPGGSKHITICNQAE